jgi:ribosome-binding factor A
MPGDRMRRVNEAVKEVLSTHIAGDLRDPRIGFVTVTSVETSPDLRRARVFVSVLGSREERDLSMEGLNASHGYLQTHVASELRLKNTPVIEFVYDDSIDTGMRISELLEGEQ